MSQLSQLSETPPLPGAVAIPNINKIIRTIATDFAGPDDPAAIAWPYCTWADTGNDLIKRRNAANNAWVVEGMLFKASLPQYLEAEIPASNKGPIYVVGKGAMEWDGAAYAASTEGLAEKVVYDNTASGLDAENVQTAIDELAGEKLDADKNIVLGTAVAATGTAIDFTGIPSTAKRITVMFDGVSTNSSASSYLLRLGDSSGIATTGYKTAASLVTNGVVPSATTSLGGFYIYSASAANVFNGSVVFEKLSDLIWAGRGSLGNSTVAAECSVSGTSQLTGNLTTVRLTTVNGTDQFDAGTVNISWE